MFGLHALVDVLFSQTSFAWEYFDLVCFCFVAIGDFLFVFIFLIFVGPCSVLVVVSCSML